MRSIAREPSATICAAGIVGRSLVLVGILVLLLVRSVFTPTSLLQVTNDISTAVQLSSCGSDPFLLSVGETGPIDPNPNDPHAACFVYGGGGSSYLGCLSNPSTRFKDWDIVRVSLLDKKEPETNCGR